MAGTMLGPKVGTSKGAEGTSGTGGIVIAVLIASLSGLLGEFGSLAAIEVGSCLDSGDSLQPKSMNIVTIPNMKVLIIVRTY
jgi:hypothetical protein